MLEVAIAKHLMGGDDTICSQIRVCIFMQAVGGGRRSPCAGSVMLFEETCFLTSLVGLFIAVLFLAFTKGFHMDGVFSWIFVFPFFLGGGMMVGEQCLGNVCGSYVIKAEKWAVMSGGF